MGGPSSPDGRPGERAGRVGRLLGTVGASVAREGAAIGSGMAAGVVGGLRWPPERIAAVQRQTIGTLVGAQVLAGLGLTIGIAAVSLLARDVSGSESLAGLAQTSQVLGAGIASWWVAQLMGARGRRVGLVAGYAVGAAGGLLCVLAAALSSFAMLLVGTLLLGTVTAANAQSRYAATDLAVPSRRARDLSIVVWATTVGAVVGPNLAGVGPSVARAVGLPPLAGPYLVGAVAVIAAGLLVAVRLRPDPLHVAQEAALVARPRARVAGEPSSVRRVIAILRRLPAVRAAVAGLALAHAVMVSVMVMTPLHMDAGGASLRVIGLVISLHVLGMFAFAPLVGGAVDRFGSATVMAASTPVFLLSLVLCAIAPEGSSLRLTAGLFLLGLGWSLATIAASTLLTAATPPDESRTDVQGAADLLMNLGAAAAAAVGGVVVDVAGYPVLAVLAAVLACGVATSAEVARRAARASSRRDAAASEDADDAAW